MQKKIENHKEKMKSGNSKLKKMILLIYKSRNKLICSIAMILKKNIITNHNLPHKNNNLNPVSFSQFYQLKLLLLDLEFPFKLSYLLLSRN